MISLEPQRNGKEAALRPVGEPVNTSRLPVLLAALLLAPPAFAREAAAPAPAPRSAKPVRPTPEEILQTQCRELAADPAIPWFLTHGITGVGRSFRARDGRLAADVLVADHTLALEAGNAGKFGFPRATPEGEPVDAHPNFVLKTLVQAGFPLATSWKTKVGKVSLGDLVESARRSFRHVPTSETYWQEVGWTLDLFAATMRPGAAGIFVDGAGHRIDLNAVMDEALAVLERENASLAEGKASGAKVVPKRKQGIYRHPCGGLHLIQGVASWARHPEVREKWGERLDRQVDLLFYRERSERAQYDQVFANNANHHLEILAQKLKFYGHLLETLGRMEKEFGFSFTPVQKAEIRAIRGQLLLTVRQMEQIDVWSSMRRLRLTRPKLWRELVGDACHAANALRLVP